MGKVLKFPVVNENLDLQLGLLEHQMQTQHDDFMKRVEQILIGSDKQNYVETYSIVWREEGRVLRELREATGISQHAFAKKLAISQSRLKKFESGEPVQDASLLKAAYITLIRNIGLKEALSKLEGSQHENK